MYDNINHKRKEKEEGDNGTYVVCVRVVTEGVCAVSVCVCVGVNILVHNFS